MLVSSPDWSPDGQWIITSGPKLFEGENSQYDLWLIDHSGTELLRLTEDLEAAKQNIYIDELFPVWSPDGTQIVYIKTPPEDDRYDVWVFSLIDGSHRHLSSGDRLQDIALTIGERPAESGQ